MRIIAVTILLLTIALSAGRLFGVADPTDATAATRSAVGNIQRVQGTVQAEFEDDLRPLAVRDTVLFQDLLISGQEARLQAELFDGTALTLGENARLLIDQYIYDPASENSSLVIDVLEGAFLFVGGKIEQVADGRVEIRTSAGSIGVRGTTVWGGRIDDGFGVLVLDGQVTVDTEGGSVTLNEGEGTMIFDPAAPPGDATDWPREKIDRAVATISFAQ